MRRSRSRHPIGNAEDLRRVDLYLVSPDPPSVPQHLLKLARRLKALRSSRESMFPPSLFGEPGWDMMLALYIAEGEGYRMKVTALCHESGVPDSTAIRWIERLYELNLAYREQNPLDCRSIFIRLRADAVIRMNVFMEKVWARYFPNL